MAEKETKTMEETKVEQVDVNLDEIFDAAPGGDSITLPEEDKKPNIFSRSQREVDTSFLEEKVETKEEEAPAELIKDDKIIPFDDEKELEDYTAKDYEELIQANLNERTRAVRNETPKQFFNSLPEELQIAARYVADGGTDLKGLFGALSQVEETKEINPKSEKGQERIITEYLTATGYGTAEEIAEEIDIWKDLGKLEKQATKFKPKLDKMQEKVVAKRLQAQQMKKKHLKII